MQEPTRKQLWKQALNNMAKKMVARETKNAERD